MAKQDNGGVQTAWITPIALLSFENLWEARAVTADSKKRFGATMLIKKGVPENDAWIKELKAAIIALAKHKWPNADAEFYKTLSLPLKDGDTSRFDKGPNKGKLRKEVNPEVEGHWIVAANRNIDSKYPHEIVDHNCNPIIDKNLVYSGCFGRMAFGIFSYDKGDLGIGAGLDKFQKTRDGKPLGSRKSALATFGKVAVDTLPVVGDSAADEDAAFSL